MALVEIFMETGRAQQKQKQTIKKMSYTYLKKLDSNSNYSTETHSDRFPLELENLDHQDVSSERYTWKITSLSNKRSFNSDNKV